SRPGNTAPNPGSAGWSASPTCRARPRCRTTAPTRWPPLPAISIRIMIEVQSTQEKSMTDSDELANLEAERDRLRSLIAYYERPEIGFPELPAWFCHVLLGICCVIAVLVGAGMLAGQIEPLPVIFAIVFLVLTAYISTRKINAFGKSMRVFDLLS